MADNFSSSYSDTKSFEGLTPTVKEDHQRKTEKQFPRKKEKPQNERKDSKSDYRSINSQRSGQSTVLVLKPELQSREKEKEAKKESKNEQLKKENEDKEIKAAENGAQKDLPKTERDIDQEISDELKEKYHQETGRRPIYNGKKTKGFDEWLKENSKSEKQKQNDQESEKKEEVLEDWENVLENWINEIDEREIPKEIKKEIIEKIKEFRKFREIARKLHQLLGKEILSDKELREIEDLIKEMDRLKNDLFENLDAFRRFYSQNIDWFEYKIQEQRDKFVKHLSQKIKNLKKLKKITSEKISDEQAVKNWKDVLKENLYNNTMLSLNEKSIIIKIIKKDKLDKDDKKQLISILSKLPTEELISLLGENFEKHIQNYIKWGWDFDIGVKRVMLKKYLKSFSFEFKEIKKSNSTQFIKSEEKNEIKISHFRQKVIKNLKDLNSLINGTAEQKEFIWAKSIEILDEFISRAENNEITIPKDANLKVIASSILYAILVSNKNMPKMSSRQLAKIINIKTYNYITKYYRKHFEDLYPRIEFRFASYGFKRIRNIIALDFFKLIKNTEIDTIELVFQLKENILKDINIPKQLTQKDLNILREMVTQFEVTFIKFFSDLGNIVKQLIISSRIHKEIGAHLIIRYLAEFLIETDVNLFQTSEVFSRSVKEIFDYLKEIFPNFFPSRVHTQEKDSHYEYRKIMGSKLKIYAIKHIYNGKYFKNGKVKCPECLKEGLIINTDISRLKALEFHHDGDEKKNKLTANDLYNYFVKNRSNPYVLEDLIKLLESEQVILICRNHHIILHDDYYNYFKYLINWKKIFSLPSELIHILIMTSVNNFNKTKSLSKKNKQNIREKIMRKLKKRYIIELLYDGYCPTCREINTRNHLPAFDFNHKDEEKKTVNATDLYTQMLSCSEIVRILEKEKGGYICPNCHTVFHYKYLQFFDEIHEDKNITQRVLNDYKNVHDKFKLLTIRSSIKDPLNKSDIITKNIEKYLTAIYELSESGYEVTNKALRDYLGLTRQTISAFFDINKANSFFIQCVEIINRGPPTPTRYILTDKGRKSISTIFHFKDYFENKK